MKREIKFRGKRNQWFRNGEWVCGLPMYGSGGHINHICGWMGEDRDEKYEQVEIDLETVGQYTGHNIKGVDLYEDDIVRLEENEPGVDPSDKTTYYVCTWIQEWAMFALLRLEDEYSEYKNEGTESLDTTMFWTFPLDVEDIGNSQHHICGTIHDNPSRHIH